jgi:hypothetical protein
MANHIRVEGDSYLMYSGTDKTNAEKIVAVGAHEGIYLTTDPDFALNYGDHIVVFLVPKNIKVSPAKEFDFNFDAEMDTWGTHAIIIHNPEAVKAIKFDEAEAIVDEHYSAVI